jgi:NitT/TauT family transport system ATP-binding protein
MVRVIRDEVAGRGTTVLLVTHSSHDVGALATRVVALDGSPARIVRDAPVRQPRAAE